VIYAALRYLKEVSAVKLSMTMVYYIGKGSTTNFNASGSASRFNEHRPAYQSSAVGSTKRPRIYPDSSVDDARDRPGRHAEHRAGAGNVTAGSHCFRCPTANLDLVHPALQQGRSPAAAAVWKRKDKNVSIITENIAGVHVVKAFATEKQETDKYGGNCDMFKTRVLKRIRLFANFNPIIRSIAMASYLSLFLLAGC